MSNYFPSYAFGAWHIHIYTQKIWALLTCSKAVGNAHNNDKLRPYIMDACGLITLLLIELPTFWSST